MNETLLLIVIAVLIYFNKNKTQQSEDDTNKKNGETTSNWSDKLSNTAKLISIAILDKGQVDILQDQISLLKAKIGALPKVELTALTDPQDAKKIVGYEVKTNTNDVLKSDAFNALLTVSKKIKEKTGKDVSVELITNAKTPLEENYFVQRALTEEGITFGAKTNDKSAIYQLNNANNTMMVSATPLGQSHVIVGQEVSLSLSPSGSNGTSQNLLTSLGLSEAQVQALLQAPPASTNLLPSSGSLPAESQATLMARAYAISDEIQPIVVKAQQIAEASGNAQAISIANQAKAMAQKTVDATFAGNYGGAIELGFQTKLLAQQALQLAGFA